jgi:hypothetical protein
MNVAAVDTNFDKPFAKYLQVLCFPVTEYTLLFLMDLTIARFRITEALSRMF